MNNLKELFEIQAGLDAEILKNHPIQPGEDRLEKKHAALLVELGEMFNEWRAFKFWSNDQTPRTEIDIKCLECEGLGLISHDEECAYCEGTGYIKGDLVLKELVDCLHFVLSIGIEMQNIHPVFLALVAEEARAVKYDYQSIEQAFISLLQLDWTADDYEEGINYFIGFTEKLGYTWEQVTEAYLEKNQENHYRQMNGY
ncbi:nucleoside triphosphate pyrophosphohydrolase [Bacillus phage Pascal]|uniref:dUTPase n=1 Tax=Bacillus phage Pascal TaxID=1540092 RepID=A0A0A0RNJ8_9CAUD|nr:nucleoside triphosphate pyrophosphohydrolase [Bacillus phage Pascal]AIW03685.1 dUTPase [Bacillus phage Pascal]